MNSEKWRSSNKTSSAHSRSRMCTKLWLV